MSGAKCKKTFFERRVRLRFRFYLNTHTRRLVSVQHESKKHARVALCVCVGASYTECNEKRARAGAKNWRNLFRDIFNMKYD